MKKKKEYALYKGDEILAIGTINEIAKKLNKNPLTLIFLLLFALLVRIYLKLKFAFLI